MASSRVKVRLNETSTAIVRGEIDLSEWDEEELLRGRLRDKNGNFTGAPPKLVPREIYLEFKKRVFRAVDRGMAERAAEAAETLAKMAVGEIPYDAGQHAAIESLLDRVIGKPVERTAVMADVSIAGKPSWMEAIEQVTVRRDEWAEIAPDDVPGALGVVDAEVLDDDDWDFA